MTGHSPTQTRLSVRKEEKASRCTTEYERTGENVVGACGDGEGVRLHAEAV